MQSGRNRFWLSAKNRVSNYRYHKVHKHAARQILKKIEAAKGKTDKRLIKLSYEYSKEVLGWDGFAPWLHVYSAVNNEFREGWIPDNYFAKVVIPVIDGGYDKLSDHKALARRLFKSDAFPDIAYSVNGLFLNRDSQVIPQNNLKESLFHNRKKVVFKKDNSMQGKGIYILDNSNFSIKKIASLGNGVFQYFIKQHPVFEEMMPDSVATIRLTTFYEDNSDVSVRGCFLRLGRDSEKFIRWSSNILIPVNLETGELNPQGHFEDLVPIYRHPDTNIIFSKQHIPFYDKCIATAVELHKQMPFNRCIGWDMTVDTDNNVKVMEWNGGHNDIKIHEALQGPCFSNLGWEKLWKENT